LLATLIPKGEKMNKLLTIEEAISLLRISKPTIYRLTSQRKIPFIKIGECVRFLETRLMQWIEQQAVEPGKSHEPKRAE
jgi:excisionase family DNA binding protein